MKGPGPLFLRGDNFKIVKIHWPYFKIFFSRTTGPVSTKFGTKHSWMKGIQVFSNEFNSIPIKKIMGFFLFIINIMIIKCVYWFELFSQVNDVAHWPLVGKMWRKCIFVRIWYNFFIIFQILQPTSALIVVDVQNDFLDGNLALRNCPAGQDGLGVIPAINSVLDTVNFELVVYTRDWHPADHISFADNKHIRPFHSTSQVSLSEGCSVIHRLRNE